MKTKKKTIGNPSAMKPMNRIESRIENRKWVLEGTRERAMVSFHFSITLLLFCFYPGVSEEQKAMQSILAVGFFLSFSLCAVAGRNILVFHFCGYLQRRGAGWCGSVSVTLTHLWKMGVGPSIFHINTILCMINCIVNDVVLNLTVGPITLPYNFTPMGVASTVRVINKILQLLIK